ncbi:hypothetical protein EPICR_140037 [Candidatus Desulfarcum epimagneticum]|uniref:Integrase catalytic domain-containing protein n=1 Tax=uncultured Desulfobacteraceae bacterium TaxID=218296 RepID=A0A484HDL7_9BACT|nr:hypothetical protein EPICR_140037 [uncultured Desulfobacteraceae bacterium]
MNFFLFGWFFSRPNPGRVLEALRIKKNARRPSVSTGAAVMAYNDLIKKKDQKKKGHTLNKKTVIGLKNLDPESEEYRSFKQLVERLKRTYKYHTRPRAGFKIFDGAVCLTTLFVAFYNFMRPHSSLNQSTPVSIEAIDKRSLMPDKWVPLIKAAATA